MFLLRPPNLLRRRPFLERENVCNSRETGVRARYAAIVNHPAVLKILRVVNLLRVLFLVRRGPLGRRGGERLCNLAMERNEFHKIKDRNVRLRGQRFWTISSLPPRLLKNANFREKKDVYLRGAPSTVRNFMTSSGCSMEGAPSKKETVPTVLGVAQF